MEFKMHTHQDSADTIWKGSWWQLLEALSLKKKHTNKHEDSADII